ncbi:MAG: lysylphosphatidylglycerol synthase transmembrane domain-containing protein [Candidatus Omnitrophota bacterium]
MAFSNGVKGILVKNMRKIISFFVRIAISIGALLFLFKQVDFYKIMQAVENINKPIFVFAFLLALFASMLCFFRWRMILLGLGLKISTFLIFRSFCIGYFSNLFFPSTVGGDFSRSIDLGLRTQKPRQVAASVILDRLSGFSALVIIALFALLFVVRIITEVAVFFALGIFFFLIAGILLVLFNNFLFSKVSRLLRFLGRIGKALSNLHYEIYNFRNQKRIILISILYSLVIQLIIPISFYLLSRALGVSLNPMYFFVFVPLVTVISALPVSIAGLGLREASSMYFFTKVGMPGEVALAIALLSFFMLFLIGLSGGLFYVFTFSNRRIQHNQAG